jgi:hypothetical protein
VREQILEVTHQVVESLVAEGDPCLDGGRNRVEQLLRSSMQAVLRHDSPGSRVTTRIRQIAAERRWLGDTNDGCRSGIACRSQRRRKAKHPLGDALSSVIFATRFWIDGFSWSWVVSVLRTKSPKNRASVMLNEAKALLPMI